jgi:hypothetical protein
MHPTLFKIVRAALEMKRLTETGPGPSTTVRPAAMPAASERQQGRDLPIDVPHQTWGTPSTTQASFSLEKSIAALLSDQIEGRTEASAFCGASLDEIQLEIDAERRRFIRAAGEVADRNAALCDAVDRELCTAGAGMTAIRGQLESAKRTYGARCARARAEADLARHGEGVFGEREVRMRLAFARGMRRRLDAVLGADGR